MYLRCVAVALLVGACGHHHEDQVLQTIEDRTGARVDREREPEQAPSLPPKVDLDDGLSADEAVAIAVWNSPNLRANLGLLAGAEGELVDARRPSNPTLRVLFPAGGAQLSALLTWPLEAFATMPSRIKLAQNRLDALEKGIVNTSVELMRDARLAHADWLLAHDRSALRDKIVDERAAIAEIVGVQAELGARTDADLAVARAELGIARDEAQRATIDLELATLQLRSVIGWADNELEFEPEPESDRLDTSALDSADSMVALALESRSDLRAVELAVEGAEIRLRLERWAILGIAAAAQGTRPPASLAVSAGPQVVLPIFSQNQAGRARARTDIDVAKWRYRMLSDQIAIDVRQSHARWIRAIASYELYRTDIVEAREQALAAARSAWELGDRDLTGLLLTEQDLDVARLRMVELRAEVRRARAELERALGGRLEYSR